MKDQSRRKLIINSAKIGVAVIGAATLGKYLLLSQTSEVANVQFPETNCGSKNKGGQKILVAYASESGTTAEVAEAIGEVLCQEGNTVETKWVKKAELVKANQKILQQLPVAYFFTCLVLHKLNTKGDLKAKKYSDKLQALVPQVKPVSIGGFVGVLDYSKMGFFSRLLMKVILFNKGVKEGDYRDWDAIRAWAKDTQLKLNPAPK
jgi:menaquinone-dependent protoporphyrinogen oxidase